MFFLFDRANPHLGDTESIITSLQTATKTISNLVRKAALTGSTGYHTEDGSLNIQGKKQKKLDVICNEVIKSCLKWSGKLGVLASEEEEWPIILESSSEIVNGSSGKHVVASDALVGGHGNYVAVFDPLDGSSNVDVGIPVGTIFGIFRGNDECIVDEDEVLDLTEQERRCLQNTLQPGTNLVAAGYCLYSSSTVLVLTLGDGVHGFTLDDNIGEFVLTHPHITIPIRGKTYSFNEAHRWDWQDPVRQYITDIQKGKGKSGKKYSCRYIGCMVADMHRTLLDGGIFGLLKDRKTEKRDVAGHVNNARGKLNDKIK